MITGTGLVFAGRRVLVPGVNVISWLDDPRLALKMPEDGRRRRDRDVRIVALHSTRGAPDSDDPRPQTLLPGLGPSTRAGYEVVQDWRTDHRCAGGHLVIDFDGVVYQLADLVDHETYHATSINAASVGIEIKQGRAQNEFHVGQLAAVVAVTDSITAELGIPRCIPDRYRGPLDRLAAGGRDYYGVCGHRDQTGRRGAGDPGDYAMDALAAAGYVRIDVAKREDRTRVAAIQRALGFSSRASDGLPGPVTRRALAEAGYAHGLWTCPPAPRAA